MLRRHPARRRAAVLRTAVPLTVSLVGSLLLGVSPARAATNPVDANDLLGGGGGGIAIGTTAGITDEPAPEMPVSPWQPTAPNPHVVIFSSGVDTSALPEAFRSQITAQPGADETDVVGFGTWTAASILQVAPGAHITSVNVFVNGRFSPPRLREHTDKIYKVRLTTSPRPVDAVLLAYPPEHYLDPTSVALNPALKTTIYKDLFDTMSDRSTTSADGENVGSLTGGRDTYHPGMGAAERTALTHYQTLVSDWRRTRASIQAFTNAGVPVVAPAGDAGSKIQSVAGLSNLREVVTVGAVVGGAVASASASGPSLEGAAKPDVLAPPATVAIVPANSALDKALTTLAPGSGDVWDEAVEDTWDTADTVARGRLASTLGAATIVATGLAGLHNEGLASVATMRGALLAAAEPLPGVPAWRQGAGALTLQPDLAFAQSRPLVGGNADLGITPATGAWSATLPVTGGTAASATTELTDYAGFGRRGESIVTTVAPTAAPPVAATTGAAVTLTATSGVANEGLYCGYTTVQLPAGAGAVTFDERVPTCLVQAMAFYAESRYIHNEPAEDVTYELLPALPPKVESLADRPLSFLPMDPTHVPLYVEQVREGGCKKFYPNGYPSGLDPDHEDVFEKTKVAPVLQDNETCAVFPAIPPGYYQTRLFANYGSPVTDGVRTTEIGERAAYQKLPMWILPSRLDGLRAVDGTGEDEVDGSVVYRYDKTTNTWVVGDLDAAGLRFAYGHIKRIVGTNVTSRVIDLLDYDSIDAVGGFDAFSLAQLTKQDVLNQLPVGDDLSAWRWTKSLTEPTGIDATFNPVYTPAGKLAIGLVKYPINLTTPNYLLHASVNFKYQITDAIVQVVLHANDELAVREFQPKGDMLVEAPPGTPNQTGPWGTVTGEVNVEFNLKSKGASQGYLYIVTIPTAYKVNNTSVYTAAAASFSGLSIQYDTWTNATWPQVPFCPNDPVQPAGTTTCPSGGTPKPLHVFSTSSNYTPTQVVPGNCRMIVTTRVCEDWSVQVHAPKSDARIYDVRYGSADPNDPKRSSTLISDQLARYGVFRHTPAPEKPRFVTKQVLDVVGWPGTATFRAANPFNGITNNRFWDNVSLPLDFVTRYPGSVAFRIENNGVGHDVIAPPGAGQAARVSPYVCYVSKSSTVGGLLKVPDVG